ncbi:MAG: hypothetical protein LBI68_08715 [Azoarcus sp.]|jgi:hypothetical protein|nr:hypothetical protein [Azoarcus sp.]
MVIGKRRIHPLFGFFLLFLFCAIAWAVVELSGLANKSAADSGVASANLEMSSLETIQRPAKNPPPVDWKKEQRLKKELTKLDAEYKSIAAKAQKQASQKIDDSTREALLAAAGKFSTTSDQYADVWEKGKCITRARLAREVGASRVASAELIVAGADSDKIEALNTQQSKLNEARKAYIEEAKANQELSAQAKATLKGNLMPKALRLVSDISNLVVQVTDLLNQIRQQTANPNALIGGVNANILAGVANPNVLAGVANPNVLAGGANPNVLAGVASPHILVGSALVGGISACASTGGSIDESVSQIASTVGESVGGSVLQLLSPVMSLLSLVKGLAENAQSLVSDITSLAE